MVKSNLTRSFLRLFACLFIVCRCVYVCESAHAMSCVRRLEGAVFWEMLLSLHVAYNELRPQAWQQVPPYTESS